MLNRRFDLWLPNYVANAAQRARASAKRRTGLTHIMFLVCDHFEPRHGISRPEQAQERMMIWARDYASFQQRCKQDFGTAPLHTWFYPPHHGSEHLAGLAEMAHHGMGEVELHYHHDDDSYDSLRRDLAATIAEYQSWGLLLASGQKPRTSFGFVHGDWALNNSCAGRYCGVNDETALLQELGCWADFTMPSGNKCQTQKINSIYYGLSDQHIPKAHDNGVDARVGETSQAGLLMIQGPLGINWRAPDHPRPENASLTSNNWGRPDRIPVWLKSNVHVKGRPDWLFVKLHTHGAIERDFDALFGDKALAMHRTLNDQYNDGKRFRLHYVTARQAYNIAKAAEHGKDGDPSEWVDFSVPPPATRHYALNARHALVHCTAERLAIGHIESGPETRLCTRLGALRDIVGPIAAIDIDASVGHLKLDAAVEDAQVTVQLSRPAVSIEIKGATLLNNDTHSGKLTLQLDSSRRCDIVLGRIGA